MHKQILEQLRELCIETDWSFFDDDHSIPNEIRAQIRPLSKSAAKELWYSQVSQVPLERHVILLSANHWIKPDQQGPDWLTEFSNDLGIEVSTFLQAHFKIPSDELVFLVLMREIAYQVPIVFLTQYWRTFLALDDEAPLALHLPSGRYALFGPNGYLSAGNRSPSKAGS